MGGKIYKKHEFIPIIQKAAGVKDEDIERMECIS
jgi:hypothetical protein